MGYYFLDIYLGSKINQKKIFLIIWGKILLVFIALYVQEVVTHFI